MYRELIEQYAQDNAWIKIQNAASETQIAKAEQILGYSFPSELRDLLGELNGDKWLFFSTEEIAELSQDIKGAWKDLDPDIDRHIFFAGNGCGDYYCYCVSDHGTVDSTSIFIWQHEELKTKKAASNMQELIHKYYQDEL